MSHNTSPVPFKPAAALSRQISAVRNLALHGAQDVARELCASIFLKQSHALAADHHARLDFVECILLLRMNNLLGRLLRATHGAGVSASTSASAAQRLVLTFSNGSSLLIPPPQADAGLTARAEHAAYWSERILTAAKHAQSGMNCPPSTCKRTTGDR